MAGSIPCLLQTKPWRMFQFWIWLAFVFSVGLSTLVAMHWFGGAVIDINKILTNSLALLLIAVNCNSVRRVKFVAAVLCVVALYYVAVGGHAYRKVIADPDTEIA